MSGVMELAEEFWSMGLSGVPDKNLCADHLDDTAVKSFIRKNSSKGACDYCGKGKKVVPLEDVMKFLMETVQYFYTDAGDFAPWNSEEGGYLVETTDGWDLLQDHFGLEINDAVLFDDMQSSIDYGRAWADEQGYYGTGPDSRWLSWAHFSRLVKHKVRYLFPQYRNTEDDGGNGNIIPSRMLAEIGKLVAKFDLIKTLAPGIKIIRCRQHKKSEIIGTIEQMCAPEIEYCCNPNRMSPAGISMFYGAFEEVTALIETLDTDWSDSNYTTVQFQVPSTINVIDLSQLPDSPSPFAQNARNKYFELNFLRSFIRDLTKPIERDRSTHIEYVPTQIVTEYFRYGFKNRVDGIIYPSSRVRGKNAIVLFYDHYESKKRLNFLNKTMTTKGIKEYDPLSSLII